MFLKWMTLLAWSSLDNHNSSELLRSLFREAAYSIIVQHYSVLLYVSHGTPHSASPCISPCTPQFACLYIIHNAILSEESVQNTAAFNDFHFARIWSLNLADCKDQQAHLQTQGPGCTVRKSMICVSDGVLPKHTLHISTCRVGAPLVRAPGAGRARPGPWRGCFWHLNLWAPQQTRWQCDGLHSRRKLRVQWAGEQVCVRREGAWRAI